MKKIIITHCVFTMVLFNANADTKQHLFSAPKEADIANYIAQGRANKIAQATSMAKVLGRFDADVAIEAIAEQTGDIMTLDAIQKNRDGGARVGAAGLYLAPVPYVNKILGDNTPEGQAIINDVWMKIGISEGARHYVDERAFQKFLTGSDNLETLLQSIGKYITITAAENHIPNWCKKYYDMTLFKIKMKSNFSKQKDGTYLVFEKAFGQQWEKVINMLYDGLYSTNKDRYNSKMELDYELARQQMAAVGENLSKKDFCKKIATDAEWFVNYENEQFYKEFGK